MNETNQSPMEEESTETEMSNEKSEEKEEEKEGSQDEIEQLRQKLKEKQEEIDRLKSLVQRVKADFENYKKKRREQEQAIKRRAREDLLEKILDPLDGLRSALDLGVEAQSAESLQQLEPEEKHKLIRGFYEGIDNVLQQFQQVLQAEEMETIDPEGKPFDSQEHEAVGVRPGSKDKEGLVAETMQVGYKHQDHVIRPARVFVYKSNANEDYTGQ